MDYSLLLGIHNISVNKQETLKSRKPNLETRPYSDQVTGGGRFGRILFFSSLDADVITSFEKNISCL